MANKRELEQLFNLKAAFPAEEEKKVFFKAARDNDVATLGKIIEKWPDAPRKWESGGDTIIIQTYRDMNAQTLGFLVEKGADLNQYDSSNFWNPLALAAHGGYAASIQDLLRLGADVDAKNQYGQTALYWAARENKLECVDILVLCGADPEKGFEGARNENVREVIRAAQERREKFLAPESQEVAVAPAPMPQPAPVADEKVIHILKRLELTKGGKNTASAQGPVPQPVAKKGWVKRILGR